MAGVTLTFTFSDFFYFDTNVALPKGWGGLCLTGLVFKGKERERMSVLNNVKSIHTAELIFFPGL